jgi:hypothetical protein
MKAIRLLFVLICTLAAATAAFAGRGSNLGNYAQHFQPAVLAGTVIDATGRPAAGALVESASGHTAVTDENGRYTLNLDVTGLYRITVTAGSVTSTRRVSVATGTTTTENWTLGGRRRPVRR